jgi:hypothetical protein
MPAGRPSEYRPEYAEQAEKLCLLGATDIQLADFFEVDTRTIHRWKNQYPDFCHSLKVGKAELDQQVERSLYHRAVGFEHEAVKIFTTKSGDVITAPYREIVPPDTTACIFWLKNRKSAEWRDKTPGDAADNPLNVFQVVSTIPRPPNDAE